jgi:hypothetical protein
MFWLHRHVKKKVPAAAARPPVFRAPGAQAELMDWKVTGKYGNLYEIPSFFEYIHLGMGQNPVSL